MVTCGSAVCKLDLRLKLFAMGGCKSKPSAGGVVNATDDDRQELGPAATIQSQGDQHPNEIDTGTPCYDLLYM